MPPINRSAHRERSDRRLPAATSAARAEQELAPARGRWPARRDRPAWPARGRGGRDRRPDRDAAVARRAPLRPRRRGARRRSRSALYQWYTDSAWWLPLTPPASSARSPQEPSPARWRRWRRRAGRSGSTRRRAARAAPPRRPPTSGAPCSSAVAEERGRLRVRAGPRRGPAGVGGVAQRARRVAGARARGGPARPGPRAATTRGRRACGGGTTTSPPGGRVPLIAMRHRSWRNATPREPRRISPATSTARSAGSPTPRWASRWSGIASGAQARRWSRSQASAARPLVRARMASRTVRGISLPSWSSISTT